MFSARRSRLSHATVAFLAVATPLAVLTPADPVAAVPMPADLAVEMTATPDEIPVTGDRVDVAIDVINRGGSTANDITLTMRPPDGAGSAYERPSDSLWQCTSEEWVMTCTHPSVPPGQSTEHLEWAMEVPEGVDGKSVKFVAEVTTGSIELFTDDNVSKSVVTYDADILIPDLSLYAGVYPALVIPGETARMRWAGYNTGSTAADDVTVRITVPPVLEDTARPSDHSDPAWRCAVLSTPNEWECKRGSLAAGASMGELFFSIFVPEGTPGEKLTVIGTVRTSTEGDDLRDNTAEADWTYAPRTIVRGQFWEDADRDGQRDPGEGTVAVDAMVHLVPEYGGHLQDVTVMDGVYNKWVRSDDYRLHVVLPLGEYQFTAANIGDDATDSDVRIISNSDWPEGESDAFRLSWGDEVVLDVGLVKATE